MVVVTERYARWWERQCDSMAKYPARILRSRLSRLQAPKTPLQALEHIRLLSAAVSRFSKENPSLRWACKLQEDLSDWDRVFSSFLSIEGWQVQDVTDAFVEDVISLEEALSLIHE